jgi:tight adherence protein B
MSATAWWAVVVTATVGLTAGAAIVARDAHRTALVVARLVPPHPAGAPPTWFTRLLGQAGLHLAPERAWTLARLGGSVPAVVVTLWWPQVVVGMVVVGTVARHAGRRTAARRARRAYDTDLAHVLDGVIAHLTADASLPAALAGAAAHPSAVGRDLAGVLRRHHHGQGFQAALDHWALHRATPGVRLVVDSLAIAGASGGSQHRALLSAQATLREREALRREIRALSSQARTSGVVLAVLPAAFALLVALIDPRVAAFLASPAGWVCVAGGLILNGLGAVWMIRLGEGSA